MGFKRKACLPTQNQTVKRRRNNNQNQSSSSCSGQFQVVVKGSVSAGADESGHPDPDPHPIVSGDVGFQNCEIKLEVDNIYLPLESEFSIQPSSSSRRVNNSESTVGFDLGLLKYEQKPLKEEVMDEEELLLPDESTVTLIVTAMPTLLVESTKPTTTTPTQIQKEKPTLYCKFCQKPFKTKQYLIIHERLHTGEKPFICHFCQEGFARKRTLVRHIIRMKHSGVRIEAESSDTNSNSNSSAQPKTDGLESEATSLPLPPEEPLSLRCRFCQMQFTFLGAVTEHLFVHTAPKSFPCLACPSAFTTEEYLRNHETCHGENAESEQFRCRHCEQGFSTEEHQTLHEKVHTYMEGFHCRFCREEFRIFQLLVHHERIVHSGERPYICSNSNCKLAFTTKNYLIKHEKRHNLQRTFPCSQCDKSFKTKMHLKDHVKVHTDDVNRPYRCRFCSKGFTRRGNLECHERLHSGTKPFTCSYCEFGFLSQRAQRRHEKKTCKMRPVMEGMEEDQGQMVAMEEEPEVETLASDLEKDVKIEIY